MQAPLLTVPCPRCARTVEPLDRYCRHCGARLGQEDSILYHPLTIFIIAFTVLGPLAIPMVWRSNQMTRAAKHGMTWLILAYFALVLVVGYYLLKYMLEAIARLNPAF